MKGLCQLLGYDRIFLQRALWSPLELYRNSKNYKDNLFLRYLFTLSIFSLLVESDSSRSVSTFYQIIHLSATLGIDHVRYLALHNILVMLSIGACTTDIKNTAHDIPIIFSRSSSFFFGLGSVSNGFILFQNSTDILQSCTVFHFVTTTNYHLS